jgi:hypothetical protein
MFAKSPLVSHNYLKIVARETLLKTFSTSTCITTQSCCRSKRAQMPKRMASQPPRGIGALEIALEAKG